MDQNNLNDFDPTDTYDHYDAFFQPDYDRYMRDYESYQHYVGLCEQEAGGSSDGPKRRRTYIFREREEAEQRLIDDYFGDDEYELKYPEEKFRRRKCYYLADGIYPTWSTFVKTFSVARDEKSLKFKRVQEAARKDIERAFGVLQGRWGIIRQPARAMQINNLKRIMYCCIILYNMILENEGFEVNLNHMFVSPEPNMVRSWVERCELHVMKAKELRDRKTHINLRQDLVDNQ
ncbi:ALP1-like protein isoform X1 [Tanacetum coccineum]